MQASSCNLTKREQVSWLKALVATNFNEFRCRNFWQKCQVVASPHKTYDKVVAKATIRVVTRFFKVVPYLKSMVGFFVDKKEKYERTN